MTEVRTRQRFQSKGSSLDKISVDNLTVPDDNNDADEPLTSETVRHFDAIELLFNISQTLPDKKDNREEFEKQLERFAKPVNRCTTFSSRVKLLDYEQVDAYNFLGDTNHPGINRESATPMICMYALTGECSKSKDSSVWNGICTAHKHLVERSMVLPVAKHYTILSVKDGTADISSPSLVTQIVMGLTDGSRPIGVMHGMLAIFGDLLGWTEEQMKQAYVNVHVSANLPNPKLYGEALYTFIYDPESAPTEGFLLMRNRWVLEMRNNLAAYVKRLEKNGIFSKQDESFMMTMPNTAVSLYETGMWSTYEKCVLNRGKDEEPINMVATILPSIIYIYDEKTSERTVFCAYILDGPITIAPDIESLCRAQPKAHFIPGITPRIYGSCDKDTNLYFILKTPMTHEATMMLRYSSSRETHTAKRPKIDTANVG